MPELRLSRLSLRHVWDGVEGMSQTVPLAWCNAPTTHRSELINNQTFSSAQMSCFRELWFGHGIEMSRGLRWTLMEKPPGTTRTWETWRDWPAWCRCRSGFEHYSPKVSVLARKCQNVTLFDTFLTPFWPKSDIILQHSTTFNNIIFKPSRRRGVHDNNVNVVHRHASTSSRHVLFYS